MGFHPSNEGFCKAAKEDDLQAGTRKLLHDIRGLRSLSKQLVALVASDWALLRKRMLKECRLDME